MNKTAAKELVSTLSTEQLCLLLDFILTLERERKDGRPREETVKKLTAMYRSMSKEDIELFTQIFEG